MTKGLTARLETLKAEKEIKTSNYTTVLSYRKLERLGLCSVKPETRIHENRYIFSIKIK